MATNTVVQPAAVDVSKNGRPVLPTRVTLEEYWAVYYHDLDHTYEFNNGVLEEKPLARRIHADIFTWFVSLLRRYLEKYPIAYLSALEIGFEMDLMQKTQVRRPDLGLVLHINPVSFEADDHDYKGVFDLCVELVSDSSRKEIERDTVIKFNEYEEAGVKEYWLLSHKPSILSLYRLNRHGHYEPVQQTADGVWVSQVLPGFQLRYSDLLTLPPLNTLLDDPVYADFIDPEYHAEKQRAEFAQQQVDQERQRAEFAEQQVDQERQRAELAQQQADRERQEKEKLFAYLRQQGIDPSEILKGS